MGRLTVYRLLGEHQKIALDSNVLIYVIERVAPWHPVADALIAGLEAGTAVGTISSLALAEVLSGPARAGDLALVERYNGEIRAVPGLAVESLTPDIAGDAVVIQAVRGMPLADAVHLATARAAGATAFVTNDRRIRGSTKLAVVFLDDLDAASDPQV
jgi:predicted nucleic acid-binding protein